MDTDVMIVSDPEKSFEMYDAMVEHAENFYKSLGIPYRIIDVSASLPDDLPVSPSSLT